MASRALHLLLVLAVFSLVAPGDALRPEPQGVVALAAGAGVADAGEAAGRFQSQLGGPKPDVTKLDLDAALRNLSLAACPNGTDALLSLLGPNVTVLTPGAEPQVLYGEENQTEFFASSFLPCAVRFIIADLAVGEGFLLPDPAADLDEVGPAAAANGDSSYLAVTHLVYVDYASLSVGKALALWTSAGKAPKPKGAAANGQDRYLWNLTVIAWSSDLPAEDAGKALRQAGGAAAAGAAPSDDVEDAARALEEQLESLAVSPYLGGDKVNATLVYEALDNTLEYFAANASAGDVVNASLFWTNTHPYIYLAPNEPAKELVTPAEKIEFTEQFLYINYTFCPWAAWYLSVKESDFGLGDRSAGSVVLLRHQVGVDENGTVVFHGNVLTLFDSLAPVSDSNGDSKLPGQFAARWDFYAPSPIPAPSPAPAPAPAPEPEPEPAPGPKAHRL